MARPAAASVLGVVSKGGGQPLAPRVRASMEELFGTGLAEVRVHTDSRAAKSAAALSAQAYTVGHEIVFGADAYAPETLAGACTLAHELVHVLQQRGLPASQVGAAADLAVSDPADPLELEAESITGEARLGRSPSTPSRGISGLVQRQTAMAQTETATPIRAGEGALINYNFGQFSIFIPDNVELSTRADRKDITNLKVHLFFAAGDVQTSDTNDLLLHGLRSASDQSDWVTIGVPGVLGGWNTISDAQIAACLRSLGLVPPPVAIRITGHSRGCDSVVATVAGKLLSTPIERVVLLDEAVEHVPTTQTLPGGAPDPARGSVRVNRVKNLVQLGIPAANITSYEVTNKSVNMATGASAKVPGAAYIDLDPICMAAIGEARLIEDAMAVDPAVNAAATANPKIISLVQNLHLPPRGSFTTGPAAGTKVSIQDFCLEPTDPAAPPGAPRLIKASIKDIMAGRTLIDFINSRNLARYSTVPDWTGLAAHEFFVAEIAHELTD